ncbi:UDP-N-acetylglucosamine 2-epimerase (non-hydrolyzing) [Rugosimonospora acidiphila]|uniref:UDP-N-acetylglucosamine 2-epimerase (non-hydrolyzing) n=1 Tax=Rugosimonospora acidiphila TaxID=556531 RepID=A0ABP9SNV0_9ACTN
MLGTRPEAIKLAPLVVRMRQEGRLRPVVVSTGQHVTPVRQALAAFGLAADVEIALDRSEGSQAELAARLIPRLDGELVGAPPAAVVVQGDTATALIGALVAFWRRTTLVHLEAGLRSGDLTRPFPEEANRRLVAQVAQLHLAPTPLAAANLAAEGITGPRVLVTGNTIVDAVHLIVRRSPAGADPAPLAGRRRLILVTTHRRESWGEPMRRIVTAVRTLARTHADVEVVFPVHPNGALHHDIHAALDGQERVRVTDPLDYPELLRLLERAELVLSDSGGILEEAVTLDTPALVLRDVTERAEAIDAGYAQLTGTDTDRIVRAADLLLARGGSPAATGCRTNPFGDGRAAARAEQAIAWILGRAERPAPLSSSTPAAGSAVPGGVPAATNAVPAVPGGGAAVPDSGAVGPRGEAVPAAPLGGARVAGSSRRAAALAGQRVAVARDA